MKRRRITAALLLLIAMLCGHEAYSQPTWQWGAQAGLNIADQQHPFDRRTVSLNGLLIGGSLEYSVPVLSYRRYGGRVDRDPHFRAAGVAQLQFVRKGAGYLLDSLQPLAFIRLSYLEVPVMLKLTFRAFDYVMYGIAGPNIGIKLAASEETTVNNAVIVSDIGDDIRGIELALDYGFGFQYQFLPDRWATAEFRYSTGMTDLVQDRPFGRDRGIKTRDVRFTIGASFPLFDDNAPQPARAPGQEE